MCYACKAKGLDKMIDNVEKTVLFGELFDLYGKLLTPVQENVMKDYYGNDLTLSEIAENNKISRQAIYDSVAKAQSKLLEIEEKVRAYEKINELKKNKKKKRLIITKIYRK